MSFLIAVIELLKGFFIESLEHNIKISILHSSVCLFLWTLNNIGMRFCLNLPKSDVLKLNKQWCELNGLCTVSWHRDERFPPLPDLKDSQWVSVQASERGFELRILAHFHIGSGLLPMQPRKMSKTHLRELMCTPEKQLLMLFLNFLEYTCSFN